MLKKILKANKKIILISILFLLILSGAVFASQNNNYYKQDNKNLLKEFSSDGIRNTIEDSKSFENSESDDNIENKKRSIAQKIDFIAKIGKQFFGIEKKIFFRPINKMVELKNFKAPKIINVPEDYLVIQEAINSANFGDTIKVASGEYMENIIMKEEISLIGSNEIKKTIEKTESDSEASESDSVFLEEQIIINETIINGEESGNVVSFKDGITNKTKLANFTIKNSGENLSGILIEDSSPTINDNILKDNEYGIYIKGDSSPVIQKNIINFNNKGVQVYNFEKETDTKATFANVAFGQIPTQPIGIS